MDGLSSRKKPWEWAWTIDTLSLFIFIMFISHPSCTCVNKISTNPCWNYGCHLWLSPTRPPPPLLPACLCNLSGNQLFLSFHSNMASLVRENSMPPLDFLWTFFRTVFARGSITSRCSGKWTRTGSVNLLQQVFKQWNTHLDQQTLGITIKLIWVIKEQNLPNFVLRPMYLHVQKWAVKLVLFRGCLAR